MARYGLQAQRRYAFLNTSFWEAVAGGVCLSSSPVCGLLKGSWLAWFFHPDMNISLLCSIFQECKNCFGSNQGLSITFPTVASQIPQGGHIQEVKALPCPLYLVYLLCMWKFCLAISC